MELKLYFRLEDKTAIGDGGRYTINMSKGCKWGDGEREIAIVKAFENVYSILNDAGVNSVSELVNVPVEVTVEDNCFKSFRILTEVL